MLTPSEDWTWQYCQQQDRLLLQSDHWQFCTPFSRRQLQQPVLSLPFSLAEAEAFWQVTDALTNTLFAPAVQLELCLTALACHHLQQSAHKSWYFSEVQGEIVQQYQLVQLTGLDTVAALVVSVDSHCATCLLLTECKTLAGKLLPRCSVVRVLHNRLLPLGVKVSLAQTA